MNADGVSAMWFVRLLCLLSMVAVVGCGTSGGTPAADTVADPIQDDIRPGLENIAQTGSLESLGDIREATEYGLKPVDATKAEMIMKELDELKSKSTPAAIKAKAAEIISKL